MLAEDYASMSVTKFRSYSDSHQQSCVKLNLLQVELPEDLPRHLLLFGFVVHDIAVGLLLCVLCDFELLLERADCCRHF